MTADVNDALYDDDEEEYSAEELLEQAQINAQALFLGTAQALAADTATRDAWINGLTATFIRGWDTSQEWESADILFALVTNYQSFGAEIVDADFEAETPWVTLANLPNPYLVETLDVESDLMHNLFRIGEGLAERLHGKLTWAPDAEGQVRLEMTTR